MNVREALEKQVGDTLCGRCSFDPCRACIAHEVKQHFVEVLAPAIERALRTTAESMENYYLSCGVPRNRKRSKDAMGKCVTAGVAAMVEES